MSKANTWETGLLELLFKNTTFAGVGDATGLPGAATPGLLYVSLHTADPGETGTQTTSEVAYTGYARFGVARSGAGWTVTGGTVTNAVDLNFPQCTGGTAAATHFGIGTAGTGAGKLLYKGALGATLNISNLIVPQILAGGLSVAEE